MLLLNIIWTLLLCLKLEEATSLHIFLVLYLGGKISTGIASPLEEDPVGFYLGLSVKLWKFGV